MLPNATLRKRDHQVNDLFERTGEQASSVSLYVEPSGERKRLKLVSHLSPDEERFNIVRMELQDGTWKITSDLSDEDDWQIARVTFEFIETF